MAAPSASASGSRFSGDGSGDMGFEAYRGSFDAEGLTESLVDEVDGAETTEHRGYTVVSRAEGGRGEIALSDNSIILGTSDTPTTVVDVSLGESTPQAEADDLLSGARRFVENPIASAVDYTVGTHRALDDREDGLRYVENIKYGTEEKARNASEGYAVPENDSFAQVNREGKWLSIATPEEGDGIPLLLNGGQFPRWGGRSRENKI